MFTFRRRAQMFSEQAWTLSCQAKPKLRAYAAEGYASPPPTGIKKIAPRRAKCDFP